MGLLKGKRTFLCAPMVPLRASLLIEHARAICKHVTNVTMASGHIQFSFHPVSVDGIHAPVLTSPSFACLNRPYNFSLSSLDTDAGSSFADSAASSKSSFSPIFQEWSYDCLVVVPTWRKCQAWDV